MIRRPLKKTWNKINRVRHAHGYGIHSPFAYRLVTKVIKERAPYYAYDEIDAIWEEVKHRAEVSGIASRYRIPSRKEARLLFRLVNHFHPASILEVGTRLGISSLYLKRASGKAALVVADSDPAVRKTVGGLFDEWGVEIELPDMPAACTVGNFFTACRPGDMLVLHSGCGEPQQLGEWIETALQKGLLLFLGGIDKREAAACWQKIKSDDRVRVTVDLKSFGFVTCDPKLNKQDYQISF